MKAAERHRLKHDKYAETVVTGIQWSRHHVIAVIAGAVLVMGAAVGILWFRYSRQQAQLVAGDQLSRIQNTQFAALMQKDTAREDAIRKVLEEYDELIVSHPNSPVAALAAYRAAAFLNDAGKPADASGYFERARNMSGAPAGLKDLAERGLAASLEASGKFEEAIREYKALAQRAEKAKVLQQQAEACWDIGRCYKGLGNVEQAKVFYSQAQDLGGDSPWGNLARFGLESLAHPETPKPAATAPGGAAPVATALTADSVKEKLREGMKLSEARKVLGMAGEAMPNSPPGKGIFDFDFDQYFVTVTTSAPEGTEEEAVKEVSVTKDSLSIAQRQAKRNKEWSEWVKAHSEKPAEAPKQEAKPTPPEADKPAGK